MICDLTFAVREYDSYLYRSGESSRTDRKTVDNSVLLLMRAMGDNKLQSISVSGTIEHQH
jgi:hypothetical protein